MLIAVAIHQLCIDMSWYWHYRIPSVLQVLFLLLTRCTSLVLLLWVVGALLGMEPFPNLRKKGRYFFEVELHFGCESPQVGLLSAQFEMAPRTHPKNLTKKRECSLSEFLITSRNHRFKTTVNVEKTWCFLHWSHLWRTKGLHLLGVGDDQYGWGADGQHSILWHGGRNNRDGWRSNDALMIRLMDQILHQLTMHNI